MLKFLPLNLFKRSKFGLKNKLFIGSLIVALILSFSYPQVARAAGITAVSDTMSREKISTNSTHAMKFTTTSAINDSTDTITFTYPADYNFTGKSIATVSFTHGNTTGLENTELLQAGADATHWGAAFSGTQNRVFTLTAPTDGIGTASVAAGDKIIITYDNTNSTNASVAGNYVTTIAVAGAVTESGSFADAIINDDQIVISATVDPTITFTVSANSTNFGTVTSTAVKTAVGNIDLTVSTNAANGYNITVHDVGSGANPGLYNAAATYLLGSADPAYDATANLAATAGYGLQATSASATIAADFNNGADVVGAYTLASKLLASFNAPANAHVVTMIHKAKVLGSSPAGNYVDTVTVIATGNF